MSPDLPVEGRPDDFRSTYYVAFKRGVPAKVAAFGAQRHISTGATLRIRLPPASSGLRARQVGTPEQQARGPGLIEIPVRITSVRFAEGQSCLAD
jgi:hypothetical protein